MEVELPRRARQSVGDLREAAMSDVHWPLPWTTSGILVIAAVDALDALPPSAWGYAIVVVLTALTLLIDGHQERSAWRVNRVLRNLSLLYAGWLLLIGVAAMSDGRWSVSTLPIMFGGALLLVMPVLFNAAPPRAPSARVRRGGARALSSAFGGFALVGIVNGLSTLGIDSPTVGINHENIFVALLGLTMPLTAGRRVVKSALVVAILVSLLRYPSATSVVAIFATISLVAVLRSRNRGVGIFLIVAGGFTALAVLPRAEALLTNFYSSVGRTDNSATRDVLWEQALATIVADPLVGGAASVPIVGLANIRGEIQPVPFHNTLLTLGVYAGVVAIFGLVALILAVLLRAVLSREDSRVYARQWAPAFLAAATCLSVNPVLENMGTSIAFYVLVFCASLTPREPLNSMRGGVDA